MKNIFKFISIFAIAALMVTACNETPLAKGDYDYSPDLQNLPIGDSCLIYQIETDYIDVFVAGSVKYDTTLIDWGVICYVSDSAKAINDYLIASATVDVDSLIYDGFEVTFSGLENGQTYYFQTYALNKNGLSFGEAIDSAFVLGEWVTFPQEVSYTDDLIGGLFGLDPIQYDVTLQALRVNGAAFGKYRIVDPYGSSYPYYDEEGFIPGCYITLSIDADNQVLIEEGPLGADWGYGMMGIYSQLDYGTFENGVITFPVEAIAIYDNDGAYLANTNGGFSLEIPAED